MIEGAELSKYKDLGKPVKVLREICRNVKKADLKANLIHGELSDYNIILKPDMHILIIDWPQYVSTEHPNAKELLMRDIENVVVHFARKFDVKVNVEEVYSYVTGKARSYVI